MFKPLRFVPDDANFGFMRLARIGFWVSSFLVLVSLGLFFVLGLNYGIDFRGGTLLEIRQKDPISLSDMRQTLSKAGFSGFELQTFGDAYTALVRLPVLEGTEEGEQQKELGRVKSALGEGLEFRRVETVGPKVSQELTRDGFLAVLAAIFLVALYLWFRFEWQFAIGAVASLVHDVALTIGLFSILGIEFNLSIVAAILTIVGYSLNDTVVVFDRVRENARLYKAMALPDMIDRSLNETLPRTLMTSCATLVALVALYFFGGEVIKGFSFAMIWGVLVGTYSSIYIAAPVLIFMGLKGRSEGAS